MTRSMVALATVVLLASEARAQEGPTLAATRTSTPPTLDGRLDDPAWAAAEASDHFVQWMPAEGQPPSERTEMRVLYDDTAIYVGIRAHDHVRGGTIARLTRRDREVESDYLAVAFDSRHDRTTGYVFEVNAAGVQFDASFYDDSSQANDWDAVWDSAVAIDEGGWSAEFRIPLSVLRFGDAEVQTWGLQAFRYISRLKETSTWSAMSQTTPGVVSRFGTLTGLAGLKPRRTLELRPFVLARFGARTGEGGAFFGLGDDDAINDPGLDGGLDLKLGLTSNLTLDATLNADFGQVEADQVVLNLSRFETFFPEKRPFFVEGADAYATLIQLFYSRRVGQRPSGIGLGASLVDGAQTVTVDDAPGALPLYAAAKLSGKAFDRFSIGALAALTGAEEVRVVDDAGAHRRLELAPLRLYTVGRTTLDLGHSRYLGLMATGVHRLGDELHFARLDHDANAQAVDAFWQSGDNAWRVRGQVAISERIGGPSLMTRDGRACEAPDPGCVPITRSDGTRQRPGDVGAGYEARVHGEGEHWFWQLELGGDSPTFDPNDAGFRPNFNQHRGKTFFGLRDTKPSGAFRNYEVLVGGLVNTTWSGEQELAIGFVNADATLASTWSFGIEGDYFLPGSHDIHETFDGARFAQPAVIGGNAWVNSDSRKPLVVAVRGDYFHYFDGSWEGSASADLTWNGLSQLELMLSPSLGASSQVRFYGCVDGMDSCTIDSTSRTYTFARLDSGSLSLTLRGTYTFSPRLTLQAYGQLFSQRVAFADYRDVHTDGSWPTIERDALGPSTITGDFDGDGVKDDDFQGVSLNVNIVLRWEFLPGSTLIAVYTRSQDGGPALLGHAPRLGFQGLSRGPTEDVVLLKLVYFWS